MKALTDYIHRQRAEGGHLLLARSDRPARGYVGSYQHEAQDARRFADWGFDFLKYDWCSYGNVAGGTSLAAPAKALRLMWGELQEANRDIVFNLCQYGMGDVWKWGRPPAATVGGPPATWASPRRHPDAVFRDGFDLYAERSCTSSAAPAAGTIPTTCCWADLAAAARTPHAQRAVHPRHVLVAGGRPADLQRRHDAPGRLHPESALQRRGHRRRPGPAGQAGPRVAKTGGLEVWARDLEDGSKAVGLFNRGETERPSLRSGQTWASKANSWSATSGGRKTWASSRTSSPSRWAATAPRWCGSCPSSEMRPDPRSGDARAVRRASRMRQPSGGHHGFAAVPTGQRSPCTAPWPVITARPMAKAAVAQGVATSGSSSLASVKRLAQ